MKNLRNSGILLLILVLVIGATFFTACEPNLPLEIENQTDTALTIYLKDNEVGTVGPNSIQKIKGIPGTLSEWQIVAKNSQGEVIFSRNFTAAELYELDNKVVIPPLQKGSGSSDNVTGK